MSLRFGTYSRKSNDQAGVVDELKSVARQDADARAFGIGQGWEPHDGCVWSDDGVSGGEFHGRNGLNSLLAACGVTFSKSDKKVTSRPPIDVLVIWEASRLGREQIETAFITKKITERGIRIFCYGTGREIKVDTAIDKVMNTIGSYADEAKRENDVRVGRAIHASKLKNGHAVGRAALGYKIETIDGVKRMVVDDATADIVRQVFDFAATRGFASTANALNSAGVSNPRAKDGLWGASGVKEIVNRTTYVGVLTDGKTRSRYVDGKEKIEAVPEEEWIRVDRPDLQIVSQEAYAAARARLDAAQSQHTRRVNGQLDGKPDSVSHGGDQDSYRYLFSGFLQCDCGGRMNAVKRKRRGVTRVSYVCHRHREAAAKCSSPGVPVSIEESILWSMTNRILTPELLDRCLADLAARAASTPDATEQRAEIVAEIAKIGRELRKLADAVGDGEDQLDTLLAGIKSRESRRRSLQAQLEALDGEATATELDAELRDQVVEAIKDWQGYMGAEPAQGRQILRKLGVERIPIRRLPDSNGWSWEIQGGFERAFSGLVKMGGRVPTAAEVESDRQLDAWTDDVNARIAAGEMTLDDVVAPDSAFSGLHQPSG